MPESKAEKFKDLLLRYSLLRQRAERGLSRDVIQQLQDLRKQIRSLLANISLQGPVGTIRLRQAMNEIDGLLKQTHEEVTSQFQDGLQSLGETDSETLGGALGDITDNEAEIDPTPLIAGVAVGFGAALIGLLNRVKAGIAQAVIQKPESMDDLLSSVDEAFTPELKIALQASESSQASLMNRILNKLFKESREVVGMRWTTILDSRVCVLCAALSGSLLGLDDPRRPPDYSHPSCRCILTPVFRDQEAPAFVSPSDYEDWLRDQDPEVINSILGPTRAKLFIEGELPLSAAVRRKDIIGVRELKSQWQNLLILLDKQEALGVRKAVKEVLGVPSTFRGKLFE